MMKPGYAEVGDTVVLTMSRDDYNLLLLALGMAAGRENDRDRFTAALALANRLNDGNPSWKPYKVPETAHSPAQ